jgi:hypothetical protein
MADTGRDSDFGVSGADVAIPMEDDRLKRDVKLDRLDLKLPVRIGGCVVVVGEAATWGSVDSVNEEWEVCSSASSASSDFLFLCLSIKH